MIACRSRSRGQKEKEQNNASKRANSQNLIPPGMPVSAGQQVPSKQRAGAQQKPKKQVLGVRSSSAMNASGKHIKSRQPDTKFDLTFKNPQQSF